MSMMRTLSIVTALLPLLVPSAVRAQSSPHFAPQAFLAGSCWKGTFPDGKRTDEHCFEWIYGGQFLRDRHTVKGGEAPYGGETIYYWDAESKLVRYLYINVLGGHMQGTVTPRDGALYFPQEKYSDGKMEQIYRSSWRPDGDDAYLSVAEVKVPDGWKEAWRIRLQKQK
jgi:hypothetical protein